MREFIDVTGKSEDEAIQKALTQLNMDRDDVSVEILERAKSGFLGFGGCPAKVRVYYGPEEETEVPAPRPQPRQEVRQQKPGTPPPPAPKPARPAPQKQERAASPAPGAEAVRRTETPMKTEVFPGTETAEPAAPAAVETGPQADDEKAQAIRKFLTGLLENMDFQAEIRIYQPEKGRYKVLLEGKGMGALIGRRGETLDAIQQLTSYSVNRGGGGRVRVQLDAEGYREKREQSLRHLARKVAGKVVKYRRSVTLEPMNAYERHVIHTALQETPGVTTYSTGVEPNRRVIVAFDRSKK